MTTKMSNALVKTSGATMTAPLVGDVIAPGTFTESENYYLCKHHYMRMHYENRHKASDDKPLFELTCLLFADSARAHFHAGRDYMNPMPAMICRVRPEVHVFPANVVPQSLLPMWVVVLDIHMDDANAYCEVFLTEREAMRKIERNNQHSRPRVALNPERVMIPAWFFDSKVRGMADDSRGLVNPFIPYRRLNSSPIGMAVSRICGVLPRLAV